MRRLTEKSACSEETNSLKNNLVVTGGEVVQGAEKELVVEGIM